MKTKMTYNIQFIVNEDSVVAIAQPNMLSERLEKLRRLVAFYFNVNGKEVDNLFLTNSTRIPNPTVGVYKGVARLKNGDAKNIELAKSIARRKALRQATAAYREAYKTLKRQVSIIANDVDISIRVLDNKIKKLTDEIKEG
jgi:hypothetical protein